MLIGKYCLIVILFLTASTSSAYPTWMETYDSQGISDIRAVVPLDNGHIVFAAESGGGLIGEVDQNGALLWTADLPNTPEGLAAVGTTGYLVLIDDGSQFILVGTDLSGNQLWEKTGSGTILDCNALVPTGDGCFTFLLWGSDTIVKVDGSGETVWTVQSPSSTSFIVLGQAPSVSGGVTVAATEEIAGTDSTAFRMGTVISAGQLTWITEQIVSSYVDVCPTSVLSDQTGNFITAALFFYSSTLEGEYCLQCYGSSGAMLWEVEYSPSPWCMFTGTSGELVTSRSWGGHRTRQWNLPERPQHRYGSRSMVCHARLSG